jgi:hypothetical protein
MFKNIQALPGAQRHSPADQGNGETRLCERGANVRGHIIVAFCCMAIFGITLRRQPFEEIAQVEDDVGVGVLLDHQRCRSVLNEDRQQTGGDAGGSKPIRDLASERVEPFSPGGNQKLVAVLRQRFYSTVTLLARFRG